MKLPLIVVFAVFSNSKFAGSPERSMPTPVSDAIGGAAAREMRLHPPSHCGDEANGSATLAPMTVPDDSSALVDWAISMSSWLLGGAVPLGGIGVSLPSAFVPK